MDLSIGLTSNPTPPSTVWCKPATDLLPSSIQIDRSAAGIITMRRPRGGRALQLVLLLLLLLLLSLIGYASGIVSRQRSSGGWVPPPPAQIQRSRLSSAWVVARRGRASRMQVVGGSLPELDREEIQRCVRSQPGHTQE